MIKMITKNDAGYKMMRRCCNRCDEMYRSTRKFQKICEKCDKTAMAEAHLKRRKYNIEEVFIITTICKVCGKEFKKNSGYKKNAKLKDGMRSYRAVNCSKKCSKEYIILKNRAAYRNTKI